MSVLRDSFVAGETMLVRAEGSLGWRHAFADGTLSFDISESLDLTLSYDGQLHHRRVHA